MTVFTISNALRQTACATALVLAVASTVACSSSGKKSGGGGLFSSSSSTGYQLRAFEEKTLENGLRILYIPDNSLPYVSFSLLVRTGSAADPVGQEGLSSLVAELLNKGTSKRSATQIADELGRMGAEFDASSSYDYSVVTASGLSPQAEPLLNNVMEIAMSPAFPEAEFKRAVAQTQSQIARLVDNSDAYADLAFASYLYGEHPYGRPTIGTAKSVAGLKKRNVIQAYLRSYRPNNSILAVVGQYTPELRAKIEQGFGAWEKRDLPEVKKNAEPKVEGIGIRVINYPSLVQSQIRIGNLGIERKDPRFLALRLGNTILGGAFASRLNDRIRKDLGLTYGINSGFDARAERGPFLVETFTKNASVGQAVTESLKVLEQFKAEGATGEEIDRIKGYLKGIFPAAIETPEKLALNLLLLRHYGIPDTYLTNYLRDIDALSRTDVNKAMAEAIDTKNVRILIYSKASDVLPQLEPIVGAGKVEVMEAVKK